MQRDQKVSGFIYSKNILSGFLYVLDVTAMISSEKIKTVSDFHVFIMFGLQRCDFP